MRSPSTHRSAILFSGVALLAAIGVSSATAGGIGDGPTSPANLNALGTMSAVPTTTHIGHYIAPRVNRNCPTPRPVLAGAAANNKETGDVVVGIYVSSHGKAKKVTVARSSGFEDLDNAAAASAASWHYIPAMIDSANVSGWTAVRFHFTPEDPNAPPVPERIATTTCS